MCQKRDCGRMETPFYFNPIGDFSLLFERNGPQWHFAWNPANCVARPKGESTSIVLSRCSMITSFEVITFCVVNGALTLWWKCYSPANWLQNRDVEPQTFICTRIHSHSHMHRCTHTLLPFSTNVVACLLRCSIQGPKPNTVLCFLSIWTHAQVTLSVILGGAGSVELPSSVFPDLHAKAKYIVFSQKLVWTSFPIQGRWQVYISWNPEQRS